jgi:hypothetical protein
MWQPVAGIPTGAVSEGHEIEINREGCLGAPYDMATGVRAGRDRSLRRLRAMFVPFATRFSEFSYTRAFPCPLISGYPFGC